MSNISNVSSRRTEELVDVLAHDAGIVDGDRHVRARAGTKSQQQIWKERHDEHAGAHAGGTAAFSIIDHGVPEVVDHHWPSALGGYAAGGAFIGGVVGLYAECLKELDRAEKKGEELRAAADNDAVNVALAAGLQFDPRFYLDEKATRPGVEKATARVLETMNGKDADIKAVLQQRADAGFAAAKRAYEATKTTPLAERGAAMQKWLADNGLRDRMRYDVAFGKGAEYFVWCVGTKGVDVELETNKVTSRMPPERSVHVQG